MATVAEPVPTVEETAARPWRAVQYLALAGAAFLALQAYVWISWLSDGVHQQTAYRTHGSLSWWAARAFEAGGVVLLLAVVTWIGIGCRAQRRLTFDAKFCIASLLSYWLDPVANFAQPSWFYSENWVNVNDWVPNIPLHQRTVPMIETPLMNLSTYTVGFLLIVMAINAVMSAAHRRRPGLSPARLLAVAWIAGVVIFSVFLMPGYLFHLWAYPGQPHALGTLSGPLRDPITEYALVPLVLFTPLAGLRYFTDDRGRRWLERDLDRHPVKRRPWVSTLAMVAFFNLLLLGTELLHVGFATYSDPFPQNLPKPIIANVCDPPGHRGSPYGPCPGSPGYALPLASSNPDIAGR